ncbi:MAG TPA: T9SS type A sorting domain-containing protein [Flavobacteriales bacterium]
MRSLPILPTLLFATLVSAQNHRMRHWYFGDHAGIDFSSGEPVVVNNGELSSWEASATISDPEGNLLFYTDGRTVWNREHGIMDNGTQLFGDQSALKGVLIAPLPGSDHLYHILTTATHFRYHVVDMDLNGGLGSVVLKNQTLEGTTTESLAGTLHCNKQDFWIISRTWNQEDPFVNDTMHFQIRGLTDAGLSEPVVQTYHFGPHYKSLYDHPTFSPSGSLFSYSTLTSNIYLFDFDTDTGTLTFRDSIDFEIHEDDPYSEKVYSTEFSPDERKLYVVYWKQLAGFTFIAQYDLEAPDITASKVILDSIPIPAGLQYAWPAQGRLQLGPDGRIYASRFRSVGQYFVRDTLDAILHPDVLGMGATYQRDFLPLEGGHTTCGLPAFISNYGLSDVGPPDCPLVAGIHGPEATAEMSVLPNPSRDHRFTIRLSEHLAQADRIVISDPTGALVLSELVRKRSSVDIAAEHLSSGLYFITLHGAEGPLCTRKVVLD